MAEDRATEDAAAPAGIAIVGLAGRFPGAEDVFALWHNLAAGREAIEHLDEPAVGPAPPGGLRVPAKGALADADCFDAAFFGLSPRAAALLDPQHRLFLETAWQALEDAGALPEPAGQRIGVFAGVSTISSYYHGHLLANAAATAGDDPFQMMLSNQPAGVASLVSYRLDLTGPSLALGTACSTGLVAAAVACTHLLEGQCDLAVAGAASLSLPLRAGYWHVPGGILSPDGHCRAFAADAAGTVPGNGVAAVVLRRLEDALAAGDHVYAVIQGYAVNNDGADKVGYTAPGIRGQARVVADALAMAGFAPTTISYLETHGTGTHLGDAIELEALGRVFGGRAGGQPCVLGSLKASIGHLDAAAGIAALVKLALMLDRRALVPSLHAQPPSRHLAGSPFVVSTRHEAWPAPQGPRRAGVSSFGMGGTNAHLVLEEAPALPVLPAAPDRPVLLGLSGRDEAAVTRLTHALADHLAERPDLALPDIAFTLGIRRRAQAVRRVLVCRDRADAVAALRAPGAVTQAAAPGEGVAFLFPGQGAQVPGIARRLAQAEPVFRTALDTCCALLREDGLDLAPLLLGEGDPVAAARRLGETELAQPAAFVVSYALARLLASWGIRPAAMLGHSVGEFVAAHLAGVLTLEDALRVLVARGRLIQALPRGAMLAVALDARELARRLAEAGAGSVAIAADNAPDAQVLAGPPEAIAAWQQRLERDGIACRRLATSHAFHSAMMAPALADFRQVMAGVTLRPPTLPYVSALEGRWLEAAAAVDPGHYVRHLREPVRFGDGLRTLLAGGCRHFLEVGPGSTLARLVLRWRAEDGAAPPMACAMLPADDAGAPRRAVGNLWATGLTVDWRALEPLARAVPLPPYPFERVRHWVPAPGEDVVPPATPPQAAVTAPSAGDPPVIFDPEGLIAAVALVWQQQLGHRQVAADSDFHALGGDSLLAVRVAARLSQRLGVGLPPHALLEWPTPRALAARIAALRAGAAAHGAAAQGPERPFALVTLRAGAGGQAPLFLPHAVGGTVDLYRDLVAALPATLPVYGLQAAALDGRTPPDWTVAAAAGRCVAALRAVQPAGPYRLAGSSFGGMLAYEMARQLVAAGERVALLALLDTPAMEELPRELADMADIAAYVAGLLGRPLAAAGLRGLPREAQIGRLIEHCQDLLPAGTDAAELDLHLRVFEANTAAMRGYRIEPCAEPARILFCRALARDAHTPAHPERPWQARLGTRLELVEVAGDHLSMLRPPHVAAVAALLEHWLEAFPAPTGLRPA
ncbi:MAG: beta-ketoacyl synthase N-terminal-like domain-containing protein [Geminicoccaceae bacterium]